MDGGVASGEQSEQLFTVGPLAMLAVQTVLALKVAVTALAVPSARKRTPVKVIGLVKGADTDKAPPPANTSPLRSSVPLAGGMVKVTVILAVK